MLTTKLLAKLTAPRRGVLVDYDAILPYVAFTPGIPRNIFQTTKSKEQLPPTIAENIERLKANNPQWSYQLFDDQDIDQFILRYYGERLLSYYHRIAPGYGAAKADFFRYLLIYTFGGLYLDIKSSVTKPLSETIREDDTYLLSYWNNLPGGGHEGYGHYSLLPDYIERGEIIQWYLVASPGHPLLREVIKTMLWRMDRYNPYIDGVGWTGTVSTTGPVMYTKTIYDALQALPDAFPVRWLDIIGEAGFCYSIFDKVQGQTPQSPNHTAVLPADYRKNIRPLLAHRSPIIQKINEAYLFLLCRTHK